MEVFDELSLVKNVPCSECGNLLKFESPYEEGFDGYHLWIGVEPTLYACSCGEHGFAIARQAHGLTRVTVSSDADFLLEYVNEQQEMMEAVV